jgi:hypothetical protein
MAPHQRRRQTGQEGGAEIGGAGKDKPGAAGRRPGERTETLRTILGSGVDLRKWSSIGTACAFCLPLQETQAILKQDSH